MFNSIKPKELDKNLFQLMSKQWGVITVQCDEKVNAMTASWIQAGHLWNKDVVTIYVRPQRYTNAFIQKSEFFSVAFFKEEYRKDLAYLGNSSGKDEDKLAHCNMTTRIWNGAPIIEQAEMIFVCRKLYQGKINESEFIDRELMDLRYPEKDFHFVYTAEIVEILIQK